MSELTELKNKRIFGSVFEVHVNQSLRSEIDPKEDKDGIFFNLYSAIFYGAARLGTSVVQSVPSIRDAWGDPDLERADMIFKVCCLPLISIASRVIGDQNKWTPGQRAEVTRSRFEDVANIIQTSIDIDYCMELDVQYNYDVDNNGGGESCMAGYAYLFYQKVRELMAIIPGIDWESIKYPIAANGIPAVTAAEYAEIVVMSGLIKDAGELMFKAFEKYMTEK